MTCACKGMFDHRGRTCPFERAVLACPPVEETVKVAHSVPKRAYLTVRGNLEGLFYGALMRRKARQLRLVGWVRPRGAGGVEAALEGPEQAIKDFLWWLNNEGPANASVHTSWSTYTGEYDGFVTYA